MAGAVGPRGNAGTQERAEDRPMHPLYELLEKTERLLEQMEDVEECFKCGVLPEPSAISQHKADLHANRELLPLLIPKVNKCLEKMELIARHATLMIQRERAWENLNSQLKNK